MTRVALRFNAWRVIVVATLAADVAYAATGSLAAAVTAAALLLGMAVLLATTPRDAIVLPRSRSERIIVAGVLVPAAIATGGHANAVGAAAALAVATIAALGACRAVGVSAWWAATACWQACWLAAIRAMT